MTSNNVKHPLVVGVVRTLLRIAAVILGKWRTVHAFSLFDPRWEMEAQHHGPHFQPVRSPLARRRRREFTFTLAISLEAIGASALLDYMYHPVLSSLIRQCR